MSDIQNEAYERATTNRSLANYPAIYSGFADKGIPESEIRPRVNIFTFQAWRKLGRVVRKGEKGVKVTTWRTMHKKDKATGERKTFKRPWAATVFHVSQTVELA